MITEEGRVKQMIHLLAKSGAISSASIVLRVKDFNTIDFRIKDFDTIIKIRIPFHYFDIIPRRAAFYTCLLNPRCRYILPRRRRPLLVILNQGH
jgi:hypothetical protein